MVKGYWVAMIDVTGPEGYKAYLEANQAAFRKYDARYITRGGKTETLDGKTRRRIVVIEFKDYETAKACFHSPEYQHALSLRRGHAEADVLVVEGYEGKQPGEA